MNKSTNTQLLQLRNAFRAKASTRHSFGMAQSFGSFTVAASQGEQPTMAMGSSK
jgi:hypothetical protein